MYTNYPSYPNIVNVNVLRGKCCCACVHCPIGQIPFEDRIKRFGDSTMNLDLFKNIAMQLKTLSASATLRIHSVGDPLYWGNLEEAVQYLHSIELKSWIFTSAALECSAKLEALKKYTSIIEISINSTSASDYMKTKGVDKFELVVHNLERLRKYEGNARIIVSRVQSDSVERDQEFVTYWKKSNLVDDAFIRSFHNYNNLIGGNETQLKRNEACRVHFYRFSIDTNGDAVVCFNELFKEEKDRDIILGNVNAQSIEDIWKSEKLNHIREASMCGDYDIHNSTKKLPCRTCTYCQPISTLRETSETQIRHLEEIK